MKLSLRGKEDKLWSSTVLFIIEQAWLNLPRASMLKQNSASSDETCGQADFNALHFFSRVAVERAGFW